MIPTFEFLGKEYSAYMICVAIGIFVAGPLALTRIKDPVKRIDYLTVLLISTIGVVIGGSLLFALTNIRTIIKLISDGAGIMAILMQFTGSVFYGGMIGGVFAGWLFSTLKKYPTAEFMDATALFIPLFHVFGRIGCFLAGCCYGVPCDIGFVYHYSPVPIANEIRRFPIQLAEAFFILIIFFVLWFLYKKKTFENKLLYVYFLSYAPLRFITEFFRGDEYRGFLLGLSTSQWISILLVIFAASMFIRSKLIAKKTPA